MVTRIELERALGAGLWSHLEARIKQFLLETSEPSRILNTSIMRIDRKSAGLDGVLMMRQLLHLAETTTN